MNLIIDLSGEPCLILKQGQKIKDQYKWQGLYQLSESLILEIDRLLKKNNLGLEKIKNIKVIDSKKSIISTNIAKAAVLGLKAKI